MGLVACTTSDDGDSTGEDEPEVDLQNPDPDFFCDSVDPPALSMIDTGDTIGQSVTPGLCGHVAYQAETEARIVDPMGTLHGLGPSLGNRRFSSTGQLFAHTDADASVMLLHVDDPGGALEVGAADTHGFSPTLAREDYAHFWSCSGQTLRYGGVEGLSELATAVDCASVVASTGSPTLVFAGVDRIVRVADLDSGEVSSMPIDEHWASGTDPQGRLRIDQLHVTHDGTAIAAFAVEELEPVSDVGPLEERLRLRLYDVEQDTMVADETGSWDITQSAGNGHTLLAQGPDGLAWLFTHGRAWAPVPDGLRPVRVHRDLLHLIALDDVDGGTNIVRLDLDADTEEVLAEVGPLDPNYVRFSADDSAMSIVARGDLCIGENADGCFSYADAVYVWTETGGLTGPRLYQSTQWGNPRNDGLTFIHGRLYPQGVTQEDVDGGLQPSEQRACYWDEGAADNCFAADPGNGSSVGLPTELGDRFIDLSNGDPTAEVLFLITPPSNVPEILVMGENVNGVVVTYAGRVVAFPMQPEAGSKAQIWFGEP